MGLLGAGAGCVGFGSGAGERSSTASETTAPGSTATTTGGEWSVEPVTLPVGDDALYRAAPRDAIPAIVDPAFDSDWRDVEYEIEDRDGGSYVASPDIAADDEVLGVTVDGAARAYPLKLLDWHEVVNDDFGGAKVVTYCPICRSGVVADREVAGRVRTFGVSGLLFRANLVLYDDASGSLWSQLQAQSIQGELTGTRLEVLPSSVTTWGAWRETHPNTDVLLPPPFSGTVLGEVRYNYEIDVYGRVRDIAQRYPDYGPLGSLEWGDARLRRRAVVIGVEHADAARGYPLSAVQHDAPVNDAVAGLPVVVSVGRDRTLYAYDRRVDDSTLRFREATASGVVRAGGSRWRMATGRALDGPFEGSRLESAAAGSQLYWAAWLQFHPESTVYGID
jgi:hypothetical protein